jgi:hypothetical protein
MKIMNLNINGNKYNIQISTSLIFIVFFIWFAYSRIVINKPITDTVYEIVKEKRKFNGTQKYKCKIITPNHKNYRVIRFRESTDKYNVGDQIMFCTNITIEDND